MNLILASQSPRRRQLLADLGVGFDTLTADIDETPLAQEQPYDYVHRLGLEKARVGLQKAGSPANTWVLGSDTAVVIDQLILGKPTSLSDFKAMMALLSGRTHQVMTSLALVSSAQQFSDVVVTDVRFNDLSAELIEKYWATGEPQDKAGGYGIQRFGSVLIAHISGSASAVAGLPMYETAKMLGKAGLPIWQDTLVL